MMISSKPVQLPLRGLSFLVMLQSLLCSPPLKAEAPLMAYVGTFSAPLRDVLPTQVDLPPGNGRGIHLFQVDRTAGVLTPSGVVEMGSSPSCLTINAAGTRIYSANETDKFGGTEAGSVSAFPLIGPTGN